MWMPIHCSWLKWMSAGERRYDTTLCCTQVACTFVCSWIVNPTCSYTGAVPMFTCMQNLCLKIYFVFHYLVPIIFARLKCTGLQRIWGTPQPQHRSTTHAVQHYDIRVWVHVHMHAIVDRKDKAEKLSIYIATYGDEPVNLQKLLLNIWAFIWKRTNPSLFILSLVRERGRQGL